MPNVATVLKEEIVRLARKEARTQTAKTKKASVQHRHDIAALKRQVAELERQVAVLSRAALKAAPEPPKTEAGSSARFTAKGLKSQRSRLGLSAAEYGKLVGVSSQSIYNWEQGVTRPRKDLVAKLAALRGIGKKEAKARLAALGSAS